MKKCGTHFVKQMFIIVAKVRSIPLKDQYVLGIGEIINVSRSVVTAKHKNMTPDFCAKEVKEQKCYSIQGPLTLFCGFIQ